MSSRAGGEGEADEHAAELVVDEHGAVAVEPVEREQPVRADVLRRGERRQPLVLVAGQVGDPGEAVPHAGLAGLVAVQPGHDPVAHHAAHAGHLDEPLAAHHVAGGGAHDHQHLAGIDGLGRGRGDVGVDVAHRHRDPGSQARPRRRSGGEGAGAGSQRQERAVELVLQVREPGVECAQERAAGIGAVLVDGLVAGERGVARLAPAQLPRDPVRGLDPAVRARVQLRLLLEQLQRLRHRPLGGDAPAVARQPRLRPAALMRSACRCAAWCFHSRTWASGVPSARVGSGELAVKSVAMPTHVARGRCPPPRPRPARRRAAPPRSPRGPAAPTAAPASGPRAGTRTRPSRARTRRARRPRARAPTASRSPRRRRTS